ncbi:MAG: hypothetical protein VYA12_11405 [Pseudomonadota bacterium]|nr:hypothetical protein [Pseudomonadota bacterium]MEC7251882.1 hypothetical protein [Pseudomonadota bacterium]MEC7553763.1 hypothetical protein [Pseudomonadota bacterium]MEC7613995.1 hypothetical protein [Pseudomonadota bacterium]MEC7662795.1 hypothetical protein [Pseudomonadota bacterium]
MSKNTFSALIMDLAIFFGSVLGFVGGFLLFSWMLPPSRDPYLFWPLFLAYLYGVARVIKWLLSQKKKRSPPGQ